MVSMMKNKDFAVLVGKAFLHEIGLGNRDSAVAFGRAFLLALGAEGPMPENGHDLAKGRPYGDSYAFAEN
jgi:hypothetical protein